MLQLCCIAAVNKSIVCSHHAALRGGFFFVYIDLPSSRKRLISRVVPTSGRASFLIDSTSRYLGGVAKSQAHSKKPRHFANFSRFR